MRRVGNSSIPTIPTLKLTMKMESCYYLIMKQRDDEELCPGICVLIGFVCSPCHVQNLESLDSVTWHSRSPSAQANLEAKLYYEGLPSRSQQLSVGGAYRSGSVRSSDSYLGDHEIVSVWELKVHAVGTYNT